MTNKNRGGPTNIRYIPDKTQEPTLPGIQAFAEKLKALEKNKTELEKRIEIIEEQFEKQKFLEAKLKALEKLIGVKIDGGDTENKEPT